MDLTCGRRIVYFLMAVGLASCGGSSRDGHASRDALTPSLAFEAVPASSGTRQYANGMYVDTGLDSAPAQIYRLYRAAFARSADASGLGFHVAAIEVFGATLMQVAGNFVASPEVASTYDSLDGASFAGVMSIGVRGRAVRRATRYSSTIYGRA